MVRRHGPPDPYIIYARRGLGAYLKHCWEASNMVTGYLAGRPRWSADESLLEEAATNLDNFLFVLGFADLEAEMNRMLEALGVERHRIPIPHRRQAKKAIWTDSEREQIESKNRFDRLLYETWRGKRDDLPRLSLAATTDTESDENR